MNFRLYDQKQVMLLPPSLVECLPSDHICFVINDIVDRLDISAIEQSYSENGSPAYHPRLLVKVLFYAHTQGIRSSRKIENGLSENIAFRYLAANVHLDHGTISLFRKNHLVKLSRVFSQIVILSANLGLADLSDISVDGTKIKASASRQNLLTKEQIDKIRVKIKTELEAGNLLDSEEDEEFGDKRGYNQVPEELSNPKVRAEKIGKLKKKLADLDKADKAIDKKQKESPDSINRKKTVNKTSHLFDPEANLMKMKDSSFKVSYNCQFSVSKQIIAAYDISDSSNDGKSLVPMIQQTERNSGRKIKTVKGDATYFSKTNILFLNENDIEGFIPDNRKEYDEQQKATGKVPPFDQRNFSYDQENNQFICPEGKKLPFWRKLKNGADEYLGVECHDCPMRKKKQCTKAKTRILHFDFELENLQAEMRAKLNTKEGREKYGERMPEIEPVIGNIKHNQGFTTFLCRGKKMAKTELGLASAAHNLTKIFYSLKRLKLKREEIRWDSLMRLQTT